MKLKVSYIDAFTDTVFRGNPAAVIITDTWLVDDAFKKFSWEGKDAIPAAHPQTAARTA